MSSSGSRGPPMSRYKSDYDYNKPKRKPYYGNPPQRTPSGSSLPGATLPGSSSLTHSNDYDNANSTNSRSRYNSANNGSQSGSRDRGSHGSYSGSSKNSYGGYYSGYGGYSSFNKRDSNEWRSDRYKYANGSNSTSESRSASARHGSSSLVNSAPTGANSSPNYGSRPNSYDSYSEPRKNAYSRQSSNRSSLSNSVASRQDRKGSLVSTGNRADTYYPKSQNLNFGKAHVDHYSSKPRFDPMRRSMSDDEDDDSEGPRRYDSQNDYDDNGSMSEGKDDSGDESESDDYNPSTSLPGLLNPSASVVDDSAMDLDEAPSPKDPQVVQQPSKIEDQTDQTTSVKDEPVDEGAGGCPYPINRIEGLYESLVKEFEGLNPNSSVSSAKPVIAFNQYEFFNRNIRLHSIKKQGLLDFLKANADSIYSRKLQLWRTYKKGLEVWDKTRVNMDQQLQILHPPNDEMKKELEQIDVRIKRDAPSESTPSTPASSNRRSRRHGDSVTTEAEFEEILKTLIKQDDEDPMVKATRLSASVPDLILDPIERENLNYMDSNNIVTDKDEWATRVRTQFFDNFSPQEHALFCEGFVKYPKKFGLIARHLGGLRTAKDCVIHYYLTKKGVNYKNLVAQHKKKNRKVSVARGRGKQKSRNSSTTNTPVETPSEEIDSITFPVDPKDATPAPIPIPAAANPNDSLGEELFTETGRRKRAAAPIFEGKPGEVGPTKKKPKRKKEDDKKSEDAKELPQEEDSVDTTNVLGEEATIDETISTETNGIDSEAIKSETTEGAENGSAGDSEDKDGRRTITSYWSISESTMFPELLKVYGTKWTTIADKLNTKTATMVRNYFQRNAEKFEWLAIAEEADKRLEEKYAAVLSNGDAPEAKEPENGTVMSSGPSIDSLLDGAAPAGPESNGNAKPDPIKYEPKTKSSIMSLLNSETSPIKAEPVESLSNEPDDIQRPDSPKAKTHGGINALLNTPTSGNSTPIAGISNKDE